MEYRAAVFDFDYTLGDATESIVAGYVYGFETMGLPRPTEEQVRGTVGLLLEDGYTVLSGDADPARRERFRRLFVEVAHPLQIRTAKLLPGARELLEALARAGTPVGIVTTKRAGALLDVLDALGIRSLISRTVGGDEVSAPKPDPEGLERVMREFGTAPGETLYCGDTVIDAETARRAGACFVPVLTGTTPAEAFEPYPKVFTAPDLTALRQYLGL